MRDDTRPPGERLVIAGAAAAALALAGWLTTVVGVLWASQPDTVEDLTAGWSAAGVQPLGGLAAVTVPPQQTLVAFLVGTDLRSIAGTTTGNCTATADGTMIPLSWPVLLDFSVTGQLNGDREAVAIDGWHNPGPGAAAVEISCDTADSTVQGFVALPSRTAVIPRDPWFQPWGWVALGTLGAAAAVAGAIRLPHE